MSVRSKSGRRYANALEKYKATKERRRAWAIAHAPKPKNKKDKQSKKENYYEKNIYTFHNSPLIIYVGIL